MLDPPEPSLPQLYSLLPSPLSRLLSYLATEMAIAAGGLLTPSQALLTAAVTLSSDRSTDRVVPVSAGQVDSFSHALGQQVMERWRATQWFRARRSRVRNTGAGWVCLQRRVCQVTSQPLPVSLFSLPHTLRHPSGASRATFPSDQTTAPPPPSGRFDSCGTPPLHFQAGRSVRALL